MKTLLAAALILLPVPAIAQFEPLQNRHTAGTGENYKKAGSPYFARTPYILQWTAKERYRPFKGDPTYTAKDSGAWAKVYDCQTHEVIAQSGNHSQLSGQLSVPRGGNHYVVVYSMGRWHANFIEDEAILRKAYADGKLKRGKIAGESAPFKPHKEDIYGDQKPANVESAAKLVIANRGRYQGSDNDAYLVNLAASRSSDIPDFEKRLCALAPHIFQ